MANMTLSIPEDLHKKLKSYPEIRWSEVARQALAKKIENLKRADEIASKSKLSKKDVEELSRIVKAGAARRYREANS